MTACRESAYRVTNATLHRRQYTCHSRVYCEPCLTVNSSRQNIALIHGPERGPNAFFPMSEYDRNRGSSRMMWARIFALWMMSS